MSSAQFISADMPFLRRNARFLTGNQARGEAYVRATLQAILDGDLKVESTQRASLYKAFHQIWDRTGATLEQTTRSVAQSDQVLQRLPPPARKAFLLTAIEGFTLDEAAEILDRPPLEIARDVRSAHTDIEAALKTRGLIPKDQAVMAMGIDSLVEYMGNQVKDVARPRPEALASAAREFPGLMLIDIHLADETCSMDTTKAKIGQTPVFKG